MLTVSTYYVDMVNMKQQINRLWAQSPSLTATAIIMLVAFIPSVVGIFLDPRIITGVPAWLKPAKFAISSAIYSATIAWLLGYLTDRRRLAKRLGFVIAFVINLEVLLIDVQAARGTTSHFNVTSVLNGVIFGVMGAAIGVLLVASAWFAVLLMKQKFPDETWGWALRLGMVVTVLGSATGGLMIHTGSHTVGALDGGLGIPGLGWSLHHGDLRIPHFFGLHAVQLIPFLVFLVRRMRRTRELTFVIAGSYLALVAILTWQALRGESIAEPGTETLAAFGVWLAATSDWSDHYSNILVQAQP